MFNCNQMINDHNAGHPDIPREECPYCCSCPKCGRDMETDDHGLFWCECGYKETEIGLPDIIEGFSGEDR